MSLERLSSLKEVVVIQRKELIELFGYETRNKYEALTPEGQSLFFIAENQKGIMGFFLRQWIGHWRTFDVDVFNSSRQQVAVARHPFRFLFPELRVTLAQSNTSIGFAKKRFSILSKKYFIHLPNGLELYINSGLFSPWTFHITKNGEVVATIKKRWRGSVMELFTDADNFLIQFKDPTLDVHSKLLLLLLVVLIDLNHFEKKAK